MNVLTLALADEVVRSLRTNFNLKVEVYSEGRASFEQMVGSHEGHPIQIYGAVAQLFIRVGFEPSVALETACTTYMLTGDVCKGYVAPTGDEGFDKVFSVSPSSPEAALRAAGALSGEARRRLLEVKPVYRLKINGGQVALELFDRDGLSTACLTTHEPGTNLILQLIGVAQALERSRRR